MFLRKILLGNLGMIMVLGVVAFAQEPQSQTPTTIAPEGSYHRERIERKERHRERMGRHQGMGRRGIGHFMRELNLSAEQKQQIEAITQRRLESTKGQREELFRLREKRIAGTFTAEDEARAKTLREEIHASREGIRTEMDGILTAEQRARREELQKERKTKHEERMKEHELRMKERQELRNKPQ